MTTFVLCTLQVTTAVKPIILNFGKENCFFFFRGKTAEEATVDVIEVQLPEVHKLVCKGELNVENFDVFCEKGIFDVDQTRRILKEARKLGFKINFHGEEIVRLNSVEVLLKHISSPAAAVPIKFKLMGCS